ncbi:MAG: restriction endonuclease subunit S [Humidesulfovibrio sp.]|uniref:restriction endonuclease subunit S n=1 Tax=Humidesulfovibrio sp. TaxID=2910988 RepID=UPI002732E048|nr:restriction endonuclease subunit S [Humidesulfovibrio sp.]MDP2847530.1 restriction endonuclease subunit S [Humidesulfovibrio sp.]
MQAIRYARISDIIKEAKSGFASGENLDSGTFQIRMNNITPDGQLDLSKRRRVSIGSKKSESIMLNYGDVLFNATNSPALVGKSAFFGGCDEPVTFSNHFIRIRTNQDKVDGKYLARWLSYQFQNRIFEGMCRQWVNQATVGKEALLSLRIPVLPITEQRRIAAILDKTDALRAKRREALAQLDSLTQSIFIEMFGDPVTNPLGWKSGTVQDALDAGLILNIQDGNHGELHPKVSDFSETGVPFVMANCLSGGQLNVDVAYRLDPTWLKKLRVGFGKPNDVLLSHKGTVGEVAIVPSRQESVILSPQVTYYRTGRLLDSQFLAGYFKTAWFQAVLKKDAIQSTRAYIGITRQRSLPLVFPPLELQQEYARRSDFAEHLTTCCKTSLGQLDSLFSSLQHRAFRGEL